MVGEMKYNNMTENYAKMLEKGLQYQDFVSELLFKDLGIPLVAYQSRKYQMSTGENIQGFEIKFDDMMSKTSNIYIEISEKSSPDKLNYIDSGIYRNDNSWLYIIGNYNLLYIFSKNILVLLHKSNRYKMVKTATSKGFLIPKKDAEMYCSKLIKI